MCHMQFTLVLAATALAAMPLGPAAAAEQATGPEAELARFAAAWDDQAWSPRYMRRHDDRGWQVRMRVLRNLVAEGKRAVPRLLEALRGDDGPTRILAAQTLGLLAHDVPRDPLVEAAESSPDPAVRLYAVDCLGMQGGSDLAATLKELKEKESNGDVKKHMTYAVERGAEGLDRNAVRGLLDWDPATIDSAKIGAVAPDFALPTLSGKMVRLSQYRGRPVVLVFIYGDT